MSDKIAVLIKRAAGLLLHASNLAMREDENRAREISGLFDGLAAYLTEHKHPGANWEAGDPMLDGEDLFSAVHNATEAQALTAYIADYQKRYAEFRESLNK